MSIEIRLKRGTASYLEQLNPVLLAGEPCLETDTSRIKYGDGTTPWRQLPYSGTASGDQVVFSGLTTTATPQFLATDAPILLNVNEVLHFSVVVTALQQTKQAPSATWRISGSVRRNSVGAISFVGSPTAVVSGITGGAGATVIAGSDASLQIRVTGVAGKTINWYAVATVSRAAVAPFAYVPIGGCTDPDVTNYNGNADFDDGSCAYAAVPSSAALRPVVSNAPITSLAVTVGSNNLYPEFDPDIYDYCVATSSVYLNNAQYSVTINGGTPITGSIKAGCTLQINDGTRYYYVRLLPNDVIVGSVVYGPTEEYVPGYYLTAQPYISVAGGPYHYIYNQHGVPVWYGRSSTTRPISTHVGNDFNRIVLSAETGNPRTTVRINSASITRNSRPSLVSSPTYGSFGWDIHEGQELAAPAARRGNLIGLAYTQGFYIQEQSSAGELIWEWHSKEYFTSQDPETYHANSVDVHPVTGNIIVSLRHCSAVLCIDYVTKEVLWVLQGNSYATSYTNGPLQAQAIPSATANTKWLTITGEPAVSGYQYAGTGSQHDARWCSNIAPLAPGNEVISIFDNQTPWSGTNSGPLARGVIYEIDYAAGTALHRSSVFSDTGTSPYMGSYTVVEAGNAVSHAINFVSEHPPLVEYVGAVDGEKTKTFALELAGDLYRIIKVSTAHFRLNNLRAACGVNTATGVLPVADGGGGGGGPVIVPALLLHFDGANNSTTFTDSSVNNLTISTSGDPRISTDQSKFGGASGYFDGSSYISAPASALFDLSSTNFTIEGWLYTDGSSYNGIIGSRDNGVGNGWCLYVHTDGTLYTGSVRGNDGYSDVQLHPTPIAQNTWTHFAVVKTSAGYTAFIDGIAGPLLPAGGFQYLSDYPVAVGALASYGEFPFSGYIDELRIVNNVAVYTDNFTPPSVPFGATVALLLHMDGANNSTTFTDSSSNALTVTANGDAQISTAQSKFGGASGLFGVGNYLTIASSELFSFDGNFTIEGWFYFTANDVGYQPLLGAYSTSDQTGWLIFIDQSNNLIFAGSSGSFWNTVIDGTNVTPSTGQWHHVAVARNGASVSMYLNGVSIGSTNSTNLINGGTTIGIGGYPYFGSASLQFNGYIDELRVVKGAAMYTANFTPPTSPFPDPPAESIPGPAPLLLLHFDGSNGSTTFIDSSLNDWTVNVGGNAQISTTQSKFGFASGAFSVASSDDYLLIPHNNAFVFGPNDVFTVECWHYPTSFGAYNYILAKGSDFGYGGNNSGREWGFCVTADSVMSYYWPGFDVIYEAPVSNALNQWAHFAWSYDGTTMRLFKNGVLIGETSWGAQGGSGGPVWIGKFLDWTGIDHDLRGYIDELRVVKGTVVYTDDFTPPNAPFRNPVGPPPPPPSNVSLLLHFDGNFTDSSPSALTVTANGNATTTTAQSKFGGASGYFAGTTDSLTFSPGTALTFTGDFTIEAWIYILNVPAFYAGLLETRSGAAAENFACGFRAVSGTLRPDFYTPAGHLQGNSVLPLNQWVHVAFVRSGSTMSAFVNGVRDSVQVTITGTIQPTGSVAYIGLLPFDNAGFNGYIDEFRVVKGAAVYTSNFTPPTLPFDATTSLLLHFDGANNSATFTDSSPNAVSVAALNGAALISTAQSKFGGASGYFDGASDIAASTNQRAAFGDEDFTVEMWLRFDLVTPQFFLDARSSGAQSGWAFLWSSPDGGMPTNVLYWYTGGDNHTAQWTPQLNTWYHIAYTRAGTTGRLFVDGQVIGTFSDTTNYVAATSLRVGGRYTNDYFTHGYIDELRIVKGAAMYTSNFTPPTAPFTF